jgi:hypothetical protein
LGDTGFGPLLDTIYRDWGEDFREFLKSLQTNARILSRQAKVASLYQSSTNGVWEQDTENIWI